MNDITQEDFLKIVYEQPEQTLESFNKQISSRKFKHEYVGTCDDGRVKIKITCYNQWLEKEISVITNNDQIGISPFNVAHISKLNAHNEQNELIVLFGYFCEHDLRDSDENVYIEGICDSLIDGVTDNLFGGYNCIIHEPEEVKPPRKLNFEGLKELLIDPWHVLVIEALSCETFICTYGEQIYDIIEEVHLDHDLFEQLNTLEDEKIIYSSGFDELKDRLAIPSMVDLWREDAYGPQPDEAYEKAKSMGLEDGFRN